MEKLINPSRIAFCIGLAGMVIPQFIYKEFGPNFLPPWPGLRSVNVWSFVFSTVVLMACVAVIFQKYGRLASLLLGTLLLATYIIGYIPFELLLEPHKNSLGSWSDGLKEPALAGGALIIAGSFPVTWDKKKSFIVKLLKKLIPLGPLLFCTTIILFGIGHILYTNFISTLVPIWIPGNPIFWTYFAAIALIGSGVSIKIGFKRRLAAILLSIMVFVWLFIIHIPLSIVDPSGRKSNYIIGAFSALAFSATAFIIAATTKVKVKSRGLYHS